MARIAVCSLVRGKLPTMQKAFTSLRKHAGTSFDHYVLVNEGEGEVTDWILAKQKDGWFKHVILPGKNMGISIGMNLLVDAVWEAKRDDSDNDASYDYILKYDPDCLVKTRRFMKKLMLFADACVAADDACVVGPKVGKLERDIDIIGSGEHEGTPFNIAKMLGGICALYPIGLWEGWRHDPYLPMAKGQDEQIYRRVEMAKWGFVQLPGVKVDHAHGSEKQAEMYPKEFGFTKDLRRMFSYGVGL